MTTDEARDRVIEYWIGMSAESMASAESEYEAGRHAFAVNRAYYACFYALSAVLLQDGHRFAKHSGVRAAPHRHLVRAGKLDAAWGSYYDRVFDYRQRGDYQELTVFEAEQVRELCDQAQGFLSEMSRLLNPR
jgi:uncharacterized protein (UPF0332 family)